MLVPDPDGMVTVVFGKVSGVPGSGRNCGLDIVPKMLGNSRINPECKGCISILGFVVLTTGNASKGQLSRKVIHLPKHTLKVIF